MLKNRLSLASISDSIAEEDNPSVNKKNELVKWYKNIGIRSEFHGIERIIKRKQIIIRVLWIFFFIASLGFCAFILSQNITEYFEFGVNTLVQVLPRLDLQH